MRRQFHVRWPFRLAPDDLQVDETTARNVRYLCREVAWAGIAGGILVSFLSIFALRLGASAFEVGLLTTGPAVAGILFPLPAARLVRRRWGKRVVVIPLALNRMLYAVLVFVPWAPAALRVPLLVGSVTLLAVPAAFFTTAFVPLLAKVLPPAIRARVVGARGTLAGLTSTLAVLVAGKILDLAPFPINFQIIFVLALLAAQISTYLVGRVAVPALNEQPARQAPVLAECSAAGAVDAARAAIFWRHTASAVVFSLGLFLPTALYPIVLVEKLHATNGWIGALAMLGGMAGVICSSPWARMAVRSGNRTVLVASGAALALVPLGAGAAPNVLAYIPVSLAAGALMPGVGLGLFQCLLDVAPAGRQTQYTAMYSMIVNGAAAGGPVLGTLLLSVLGLTFTFALSAVLILAGSLLLRAADPRAAPVTLP